MADAGIRAVCDLVTFPIQPLHKIGVLACLQGGARAKQAIKTLDFVECGSPECHVASQDKIETLRTEALLLLARMNRDR